MLLKLSNNCCWNTSLTKELGHLKNNFQSVISGNECIVPEILKMVLPSHQICRHPPANGEGRSYKNYKSERKATYIDILTVVSYPLKTFSEKCCLGKGIIFHCLGVMIKTLGSALLRSYEKKCLLLIFWFTSAFSSTLNTINLKKKLTMVGYTALKENFRKFL